MQLVLKCQHTQIHCHVGPYSRPSPSDSAALDLGCWFWHVPWPQHNASNADEMHSKCIGFLISPELFGTNDRSCSVSTLVNLLLMSRVSGTGKQLFYSILSVWNGCLCSRLLRHNITLSARIYPTRILAVLAICDLYSEITRLPKLKD